MIRPARTAKRQSSDALKVWDTFMDANSAPHASKTPLLDGVKIPEDLRKLPESDLRQLADELRTEMIDAVSVTGGHLGAGLGVVELTVALHWVFATG
jgi:hypothetical protein